MSTTTELDQLQEIVTGLRRCISSMAARHGDTPAMRRVTNDAERIMLDIDRLTIDVDDLTLGNGSAGRHPVREKICIPDTQYATDFWRDVDDEGLGGTR